MTEDIDKYTKLDEIEHIFKRPDMYLGKNVIQTKEMYTYEPQTNTVSNEKVTYSTGLLKIFDEILMNAVDNIQRKSGITFIDVNITDNEISISNDGKSIPISKFKGTNKYIPEVIFTQPRSGSNFDDTKQRTVGGRNGIGCKITTVFSTEFQIHIINSGVEYMQRITNNDRNIEEPTIKRINNNKHNLVHITFKPDLQRFGLQFITEDNKKIFYKRVHDLSYLPIKLIINETVLPKLKWKDFVTSYGFTNMLSHQYTKIINGNNISWNISFGLSDKNKTISYVNYISTYNGGEHVKYILNQIVDYIMTNYIKKYPTLKPADIKSKLSLFVSAIIVNPEFDSQAKEKLTTEQKKFGSECLLPHSLIKSFVETSDILYEISSKYTKSKNRELKTKRVKSISKLVEANFAGTKQSSKCTLFLCEGLSAKTMVDSGICILGHDYYGCYPLQGKLLNTRNVNDVKYHANKELNDIKVILGLEDGKTYKDVNSLRYGKVVCVKDADSDGADIMGLIMNFFDTKFKSLLQIPGFFSEFISPMIQIKTKDKMIPFYNEVEYKKYLQTTTLKNFSVKFIKGLATNEDSDIKNYFKNYKDNCIQIIFDEEYVYSLDLAFNGKRADDRKEWLQTITPETHLPRLKGKPIQCSDFVHNDLVLYSMDACVRSIPSLVDGLKPSQRKILYTLFNYASSHKHMKVFQLGGLVAKNSNYHHGDQSMNETIINMSQDFPGSNNITLLERSGQFGSRQENGKDSGQPRYISCCLSKISRYIFPQIDDTLLNYKEEDNQSVEPVYYIPIIPFCLINGALGIGMGWSTTIPAFNPYDVIEYVRRLIRCEDTNEIHSYYNGFKGNIHENDNGWIYEGIISLKGLTLTITEIPLAISISSFQELLNSLCEEGIVKSYVNKNNKDANSVNYVIELNSKMTTREIYDKFKLVSKVSNKNMVLFNSENVICKYETIYDIINEWFEVRYELYEQRIKMQIDLTKKEIVEISNKARFIKENIEETINIRNKPIDVVVKDLEKHKYDKIDDSYSYLLDMKIQYLTKEKYEELLSKLNQMNKILEELMKTTVETEWLKDLDSLLEFMNANDICL